jgi:hypothetical protein
VLENKGAQESKTGQLPVLPSTEPVHQHQVAALLVDLRIQ